MAEGDQDSALTRTNKIMVPVTAFAGTLMIELVDELPASLPQWLLLVGGAALVGLVAGGAVVGAFQWILGKIRGKVRNRRHVLVLLSVGLTLGLVSVTGPPVLQFLRHAIFGCEKATELTVLTSPSGLNPSTRLIELYDQWTAEQNGGCATVNAYVYAAGATESRTAIGQGWAVDGRSNPLSDVGPQPDVWLPDSGLEVNRLDGQVRQVRVARDAAVAVSPVVLGVPATAAAGLPREGLSWPTLFARVAESGIGVVRPDPRVSLVGSVATAALYGNALDGNGGTSSPPVLDPRAVEQWIGGSLDRDAYPLTDSPELLCRHRQLTAPQAAVILSEQDLVRFNQGSLLGGGCGAPDRPRAPEEQMIALYPRTVALDHRFVEFTWTQPGSRQAEKVAELRDWLTGKRGRQALEEVGLRPPDAPPESSPAWPGVLRNARFETVLIDPVMIDVTILAFLEAQRRSRVLLALDVSGSMEAPTPAPSGPGTRLSVVTEGILQALPSVRPTDALGLWLFPGGDPSGRTINTAVPVGPPRELVGTAPRTQAVSETLVLATPSGNTPLFRAMVDGVAALGPSDDTTANKLVVITDGEDTTSDLSPDQVLDGVRDRNVRVFVITVGETSCAAAPLESLAVITGGACYAEAPSQVGNRLVKIITS